MDVGFIILCPDRKIGGLKNSLGSIKSYSYDREAICIVGEDTSPTELKDMKQLCPTHKAGTTITGLINTGMKKLNHDWAYIMFAGSRVMQYIEWKFDTYVKDEKDIIFPVVDRKWGFVEGSFNGVMINTKFFEKVGDFPDDEMQKVGVNDFELAKMFWALDAMDNGCKFKAIVGMKIM
jgi:hypothetical protein